MPQSIPQLPAAVTDVARQHNLGNRVIWDQSRPLVPSRLEIYLAIVSVVLLMLAVGTMLSDQKWYYASGLLAVPVLTLGVLIGMWIYHAVKPVEWCAVYDEGMVYLRSGADPIVVTWHDVSSVSARSHFLSVLDSAEGPGLGSSAVVHLVNGTKIKLRRRFDDAQELVEKLKAVSDLSASRAERQARGDVG